MPGKFSGAFSIGTSKRKSIADSSKALVPGPGAYYNENVTLNSPKVQDIAISHSPRKPIFDESIAPPPGSYEITSTIGKGKGVSISTVRFKDYGDKFDVGPGSYDLSRSQSTTKQGPAISFQSKPEDLKPVVDVPGPGSYEAFDPLKKRLYKRPNHNQSFSSSTLKTRPSELHLTPGPGEYDVPTSSSKNQISTFSKSGRSLMKLNEYPGPGAFEITQKQQFQAKNFTLGSKIPIKDSFSEFVPGPGTYNLPSSFTKPSIKIGGSMRPGFIQNKTPGPGSYIQNSYRIEDSYPTQLKDRGLSYAKRPDLVKIENFPGPGNYQLPPDKVPGVKISEAVPSEKWKLKLDVPGPGAYNVSQSTDSQRGIRFQGKSDVSFISNNPGPGSYDSTSNVGGPKFKFSQSKRYKDDIKLLFDPSPGQYEIESSFSMPLYLQKHK